MREIHTDEARVPAFILPEALRRSHGSPVEGAQAWDGRRREILELFRSHVYGAAPPLPAATWERLEEGRAPDGAAVRRQVRIWIRAGQRSVGLDLLLYLPPAPRPAPVFLGLNFGGNHTIDPDPAILLPRSWVGGRPPEAVEHSATAAGRGRAAGSWPLAAILARGYGLATLYCGDAEPDHAEGGPAGLRGLTPPGDPRGGWGALGAWAFALQRACDYLRADADVDPAAIAVMGHSRLGKAALWAGAQDERFALVVSNNSGCGGAALFRREFGETIAAINRSFPHWFCRAFHDYDDREAELPVDQHMLLGLCAPRPLYVASAQEDLWADPRGEFLAALGADPVYRLLGRDGLGVREMPPLQRPVTTTIGYHIRPGGHGLTPYDWQAFLDFADLRLPRPPAP